MNNPILTKSFLAIAAMTAHRIVKHGANDGEVTPATAVGDAMFGVTTEVAAANGERQDVHLSGAVYVQYGGNVTRGDFLTSDANGKAVTANPAAGVNNRVIGIAQVSGVDGDIGTVQLAPGRIQG